jgi:uncharacterized protein (TIGR03437 family)
MSFVKLLPRTITLLALSAVSSPAQQTTLSTVALIPCCIAPDGRGGNFIVSSIPQPPTISVAKMDASGTIVSSFAFPIGTDGAPSAAAVDPQGNLWIAGSAVSGSAPNSPLVGLIAKLNSTGTKLFFTGGFGGLDPSGLTRIQALAIDPSGNLYLGGFTFQTDFPVTPGAFDIQPTVAPAPAGYSWNGPPIYGFIAKLTPANSTDQPYTVAYSTLLGGSHLASPLPSCPITGLCTAWPPGTILSALAVDSSGVVTAAGTTQASDFPTTPGAYQTQYQKLPYDYNVFVTRLNPRGSGLVWSTLLGASSSSDNDYISLSGVAVDSYGAVVVTGTTNAPSLPVTAGALQPEFANPNGDSLGPANGFVAKFDSTGAHLVFATYYGIDIFLGAPRLDAQGDIWVTGLVNDPSSLALTPNAPNLGNSLIAELAPDGSRTIFSELLPNAVAGRDLALNPDGSLTATGPSVPSTFTPNGFVLRLPRGMPSGGTILGVADAAAHQVTGTLAPGEYLSVYGTGLGPSDGVGMQLDANGVISNSLAGTQISFNGIPAPLIYASGSQVNVLVPYELSAGQPVAMRISTSTGSSQTGALQVVPVQPNVLAVLNSDGIVNSMANPAARGSALSILVSGAGALNTSLPDGTLAASPAPAPALPVQVRLSCLDSIGPWPVGTMQTITPAYAGGIPGMVIDMLRVDMQQPATAPTAVGCMVAVQVGSAFSPPASLYLAGPQ